VAILSIMRDWGTAPAIVRITTDNTLAEITTSGYWVLPATIASIEEINNGEFEWLDGDLVAINFSNGEGFFTFDVSTNSFVAETVPGSLSDTLLANRIFVGSAGNVATGVAMSGDATIVSNGTLTIEDDAITTAKILDDAVTTDKIVDDAVTTAKILDDAVATAKILDANVTLAKLAAAIAPSHVVKFAAQHTTTNDTTNAITVTGALATDLAFVQMVDNGTNGVSIVDAVVTTDTLSVTFSGAPSTDTIINYQLIRATA
jgi:hypothetical protein